MFCCWRDVPPQRVPRRVPADADIHVDVDAEPPQRIHEPVAPIYEPIVPIRTRWRPFRWPDTCVDMREIHALTALLRKLPRPENAIARAWQCAVCTLVGHWMDAAMHHHGANEALMEIVELRPTLYLDVDAAPTREELFAVYQWLAVQVPYEIRRELRR